jgi:biopolymer transport protein ExbD
MAGRRVRCPDCDSLVTVVPLSPEECQQFSESDDDGKETVHLFVDEPSSGDTVMLEAVQPLPVESSVSAAPLPGPVFRPPANIPPPPPAEDEPPELRKTEKVETEMDMTPMVDATFQLLIFFMITAAFALQKSKEIPKPKSDEPSSNAVVEEDEEVANAVIVRIDEHNSYLVINADGDEEEAPSVLDLHVKLRRAHDGDSEGRVPTVLRVEAHGEAFHGRVVTAIDAGNDAGFAEVQLASLEEEA